MFIEKRREPRVPMAMPLEVAGELHAVTRDISPSGIYFHLRGTCVLEGPLHFEMNLEESNMKFSARGSIVRVEHGDGFTGFAVRLMSGRLQPID